MEEQRLTFWANFSHAWSFGVVLVTVVCVVVAGGVQRASKAGKFGSSRLPARVATVLASSAVFGFLLSQAHIPCAGLANVSSRCLSSLRSLSDAQSLYSQEYDGRFCDRDDWESVLEGRGRAFRHEVCPGATGALSYAFNRGLVGKSDSDVDDPSLTPILFDAVGKEAVAGKEALAVHRHLERPNIAFADGRVSGRGFSLEKARW